MSTIIDNNTPLSVSRRASNTTVYYNYEDPKKAANCSGTLYPPPKPPSGHIAGLPSAGHRSTPSNTSAAVSEHFHHGGSSTMPGTPNLAASTNSSCISPCVQASQLPQGSTVEYYSQSLGRWIPAKVMSVIPPDDPRAGGSKVGLVHLDCKPMARVEQVRYAGPPAGMPLYSGGPLSSAPTPNFIDVPAAFSMFNSSSPPSFVPGPSVGPPTVRVMRTTTIPTAYRRSSYITKTTSMAFKNPGKAVQLISFDGDKLVVKPEALALLEALGHDKQVSVVTVVGMYRTGKSYLLNRLVRGKSTAL
ncbi:hypothetical protein Pmar_PMAR015363 [Perkinsus marinus ATCC 50983]|uniref:GB1/RHD3-type G domain-containing protein n=1 Tax=Perkinsus marinus (strain ATCC 50983 / TXsc) TaxID=423536 RepID=C5KNN3_PERM5|nr:hypothetical protein Pmar_PMAR015363 [Perkinsus marinus ATCC 50983]EER13909.1 hypothetical protein Pmar_PMAR015363 [Perkinsus marinus ATCC 50983]|eukprot:XP_002782114.1 hypothetical protein Pmar_PMAR015363 [Perkinsus marinus ATCC 50983]